MTCSPPVGLKKWVMRFTCQHGGIENVQNMLDITAVWPNDDWSTIQSSYDMVNFLKGNHNKYSIAHPWEHMVWGTPLRWRHNGRDSVSNHQPHHCLLNRLFRRRSKKTSKLRVTGLCAWNWPGTGEFPAQKASNAENVSIWWRHHVLRVRSLGPISLTVFPSQVKCDGISLCSDSNSNTPITAQFCTWHDSYAIVACAKLVVIWSQGN